MAGAKAEVIATAWMFAARLAALRSRKRSILASVRLKACASRTPIISSCKPAVQDEHRDHYPDEAEQRAEDLGDALREELVQRVHVVGHPAHEIPGGMT